MRPNPFDPVAPPPGTVNSTGKVSAKVTHPHATRGEFLVALFAVVVAALAYLYLVH
jgi:hypothetical protein